MPSYCLCKRFAFFLGDGEADEDEAASIAVFRSATVLLLSFPKMISLIVGSIVSSSGSKCRIERKRMNCRNCGWRSASAVVTSEKSICAMSLSAITEAMGTVTPFLFHKTGN